MIVSLWLSVEVDIDLQLPPYGGNRTGSDCMSEVLHELTISLSNVSFDIHLLTAPTILGKYTEQLPFATSALHPVPSSNFFKLPATVSSLAEKYPPGCQATPFLTAPHAAVHLLCLNKPL